MSHQKWIYLYSQIGMGGYKGGEIASKIATVTASNYIENNFNEIYVSSRDGEKDD